MESNFQKELWGVHTVQDSLGRLSCPSGVPVDEFQLSEEFGSTPSSLFISCIPSSWNLLICGIKEPPAQAAAPPEVVQRFG